MVTTGKNIMYFSYFFFPSNEISILLSNTRIPPMPLSWNEIKSRALLFTQEWKDEVSEEAETKPFLEELINVFGITRRASKSNTKT